MREIEIRVKLSSDDISLLQSWLKSNAKFKTTVEHTEFYLNNLDKSFFYTSKTGYKDAKDYLRVRMTEKGDSVCLKRFEIDFETGKSKNIDEIEYNASNGQEAFKLFKALGYTDITDVSKTRDVYDYENYEIVIDNVKGLGFFAEVELKNFPEDKDIREGFKIIRSFIQKMGFKTYLECKRGYVSMLWNPDFNFTEEITLN
ncbi:MAG: class IV adenylate cyclase [Candidatus Dojkabacteria bacterium]